jgi:hypothetical protein
MEIKTFYYINQVLVKSLEDKGHYNIAKGILKFLHTQKFSKKKILLKNNLFFWSSFVNKKYIIVINNYDEKDMKILRKEIELVAEFKLEECQRQYIIRQRNKFSW